MITIERDPGSDQIQAKMALLAAMIGNANDSIAIWPAIIDGGTSAARYMMYETGISQQASGSGNEIES